jgi:1-deoxy-D-xylulose-5-phosphate reductoisomerase
LFEMVHRVKRLAILGSTGSIGRQTLEVVRAFPHRFEVVALASGRNLTLLKSQAREFKPKLVSAGVGVSLLSLDGRGQGEGEPIPRARHVPIEEIATHPEVDLVVVATAGKAGLAPTLAAIRAGKTVALANKEVLVMAGEIVTAEARKHGVEILPIDSEHSAIWQCLRGEDKKEVARLILTASGGPFRLKSAAQLAAVTPEDALRHPTWQMGTKVTIDSATLMNKGMEIIEAHWLFGVPYPRIEVVIHPQSIIHSMVEFVDGSTKAQMSLPDMRLPIQYALTYPERWEGQFKPVIDFNKQSALTFEEVDLQRFPCLRIAREAAEKGGTYPAVLSAADEVAVDLFLQKKINFPSIPKIVEKTLERHNVVNNPSLEDIIDADSWARGVAAEEGLR